MLRAALWGQLLGLKSGVCCVLAVSLGQRTPASAFSAVTRVEEWFPPHEVIVETRREKAFLSAVVTPDSSD